MRANLFVVGLLILSMGLTAWLIVGSFVSYVPTVSATRIQNIMIARTVNIGGATILLQLVAVLALSPWRRTAAARVAAENQDRPVGDSVR